LQRFLDEGHAPARRVGGIDPDADRGVGWPMWACERDNLRARHGHESPNHEDREEHEAHENSLVQRRLRDLRGSSCTSRSHEVFEYVSTRVVDWPPDSRSLVIVSV